MTGRRISVIRENDRYRIEVEGEGALSWTLGDPLADSEFNTLVIQTESVRDSGTSEFGLIGAVNSACAEGTPTTEEKSRCVVCFTAIAAVVWP